MNLVFRTETSGNRIISFSKSCWRREGCTFCTLFSITPISISFLLYVFQRENKTVIWLELLILSWTRRIRFFSMRASITETCSVKWWKLNWTETDYSWNTQNTFYWLKNLHPYCCYLIFSIYFHLILIRNHLAPNDCVKILRCSN